MFSSGSFLIRPKTLKIIFYAIFLISPDWSPGKKVGRVAPISPLKIGQFQVAISRIVSVLLNHWPVLNKVKFTGVKFMQK